MNYDELDALRKVLDYMWKDERDNYEETYDVELEGDNSNVNENNEHIFVDMCTLGNYAQVHQFTLQNSEQK